MTSNYRIDFEWYEKNKRSFVALAKSRLCLECQDKVKVSELSEVELLNAIKDCCSQTPGFILPKLPILESAFRIFLANGNQMLTLEEILNQLKQYRGEGFSLAPEVLGRLFENERYYGLRRLPEEPEKQEEPEVQPA